MFYKSTEESRSFSFANSRTGSNFLQIYEAFRYIKQNKYIYQFHEKLILILFFIFLYIYM